MEDHPVVPVFPLPDVVLFPRVLLPLRVFEPRYRRLVDDMLSLPEERRLIIVSNMNYQNLPTGKNPFASIATVGKMVHVEKLEDGRSNIVLYGQFTADIEEIVPSPKPYRICKIKSIREEYWADPLKQNVEDRKRFLEAINKFADRVKLPIEDLSDIKLDDLINSLAFSLSIQGDQKQNLLELQNLNNRMDNLIEILDMIGYYKKYIPTKNLYTDIN